MQKTDKLVIIGDSAFAQIAYEYFQHDSPYEIVGFSVEDKYIKQRELFGLPVIPFEKLEDHFVPQAHFFFAAIVYTNLNRLRARLYRAAKDKGFAPASYVSSRAFVWHNVELGEHCFIFENNVLQPFTKLGVNVVLWSGNHIGHHSVIADNCFIASHVVMSGFVSVGRSCFFGVNATITNNVSIGNDCVIGAGALVVNNIVEDSVVKGSPGLVVGNARRLHRVRSGA